MGPASIRFLRGLGFLQPLGISRAPGWLLRGLIFAFLPVTGSFAAADQYGVIANGASADCSDDTCLSPLNLVVEPGNTVFNQLSTDFTLTNARGSASAAVTVVGGLALPEITASAVSATNSLMVGQGLAVQGYEYTGLTPTTITLNVMLTGTVVNDDNDENTGLVSQAALIHEDSGFLFNDATSLLFFILLNPNIALSSTAAGPVTESGSVDLDVDPGDIFYIGATLSAQAAGSNAQALSNNTLRMTFAIPGANPAQVLTPAATLSTGNARSVPSAPVLAMILCGVATLGIALRRPREGRESNKQA